MLKQRAISATLWSAIEQIGARGLSTIFMLIFARHLSADDFGIFAAATLATGFASTSAQFGLNTVVVQRKELDSAALSTAFWMALGASVVIAAVLAALAHPLAKFFGNSDIAPLVPVLAAGMVISVATAMVTAVLRRELNMKALARRSLLANVISGAIATPFILNGLGAWGLVIQMVGGAVLTLVLTLLLIGWPIRWTFDGQAAHEMLCFGAPVYGNDMLNYYSSSSPQLFVGIFLGSEAMGILAIGMRIANLFMSLLLSTLSNAAFPLLAQVVRQSPERLREIYLRLIHVAYAGVVLLFALAITLREQMVIVVLGDKWHETIPILLYLMLAGLVMTLNYINVATLLAQGYSRQIFFFSFLRALVGTVLLLIATPFGLVEAAAAYALRSIIVSIMQLLYLLSNLKIDLLDYIQQIKGTFLSALVLLGIGHLLAKFLSTYPPLVVLTSTGIATVTAYLVTLYITDKRLFVELRGLIFKKRGAL